MTRRKGKKEALKKIRLKKQRTIFRQNKKALALFSLLFCFIALGSTYSWFTSTDSKENSFQGTHLAAEIDEVFIRPEAWQPGQEVTKQVRVKNTGAAAAFVRLSLYEFFLSFQVDGESTGNMQTVNAAVQPAVNEQDTATWQPAAAAGGTYLKDEKYYVAREAIISDPQSGAGYYDVEDTARTMLPLNYITLNFSAAYQSTEPSSGATNYWLYEDGYFYYSELLQPGEESEALLDSLSLSKNLPNQYKGSVYKLKIFMDAHDETSVLKEEWQLKPAGKAVQMLEGKLKSAN